MQKKGYLLLEKLTSCSTPSFEQFVQDHVSNIEQLLIDSTAVVKTASKMVSYGLVYICYYDNLCS